MPFGATFDVVACVIEEPLSLLRAGAATRSKLRELLPLQASSPADQGVSRSPGRGCREGDPENLLDPAVSVAGTSTYVSVICMRP